MDFAGVGAYGVLNFFHILLFVYWLGGDLGVFYTAKYVARPDLSKPERLRFLELLMKVDMFPRMALVLMLPLGFTLAALRGSIALDGFGIVAIWVAGLLWFAMMLAEHSEGAPAWLKRLDLGVRYGLLAGLAGLGILSLVIDAPIAEAWLAIKVVLFAVIIGLGLSLRAVVIDWVRGFGLLDSDPDEGNRLIVKGREAGALRALSLWACLILMAFLGVVKPVV